MNGNLYIKTEEEERRNRDRIKAVKVRDNWLKALRNRGKDSKELSTSGL